MNEFEFSLKPVRAEEAKSQELPRLSVVHLLLWLTFGAVSITATTKLRSWQGQPNESLETLFQVSDVLQAIVTGGTMMGAVTLVNCWMHGKARRKAPGHWLLLISAVYMVIYIGMLFTAQLLQSNILESRRLFLFLAVATLPMVAAKAAVTWYTRETGWRVFFAGTAFESFGFALLYGAIFWELQWDFPLSALSEGVCYLSMLVAALLGVLLIRETITQIPRDWLHYLGVATFLESAFANAFLYFAV